MSNEHDEYYLQDKRQMVGNSMYWWRKNGAGYCCDVREAHVYTRAEAFAQHRMRDTDVPWPKAYIDARVAHHVDFQRVDLELARAAYSSVETSPAPEKPLLCACDDVCMGPDNIGVAVCRSDYGDVTL